MAAIILVFIPNPAIGQCPSSPLLIQNGDFENLVANCGTLNNNMIDAAFNQGCVDDWQAAFGTPSICFNSPASGTAFACLGTNTEAIFQTLDICPGESYQIAFSTRGIAGIGTASLDVYLANSLTAITGITNPTGTMSIDPSWQSLGSVQVSYGSWQTTTWTFTANNQQNNQLLFVLQDDDFIPSVGIDAIALTCSESIEINIAVDDFGDGFFYFEANLPPGLTGCWDFGDGTTTSGSNSMYHTFTEPGQYSVCFTALCGCYAPTCINIVVLPPPVCPCTEAKTLNIIAGAQGTPYSYLEELYDFDPNDDGIIDQSEHKGCIAISGKLIIDRNLTITGCSDIRMQPCAEIEVQSLNHLSMEYNIIAGCETMWRSITVEPFGILTFRYNIISDAQHALWVNPSSPFSFFNTRVDIQYNVFERNHIGLHIPGNGGGIFGGAVWQTPFIGNSMSCKGPDNSLGNLLPACDANLDNYDAENGYAGVVALGANFNVGASTGALNSFNNLRNGVISERVFLNVDRSNFNNMIGFMNFQLPSFVLSEGVGVVANSGWYNVRDANFDGAGHAVNSNRGILSMQRNNTTGVQFGLQAWNPISLDFIHNQDIGFLKFGVRISDLSLISGYSRYVIDENIFKTEGEKANNEGDWALSISNKSNMTLPDGVGQISRNESYIVDQVGGLLIENINSWSISDNYTEFSAPPNNTMLIGEGIFLQNSHFNDLYGNDIRDIPGSAQNFTTGFSTGASVGNHFCCNSTTGNITGSIFMGTCLGTEYRQTDMDDHLYSLWLPGDQQTGYSFIGQQPFQTVGATTNNNRFEAGSGTVFNNGPIDVLNASKFYVNSQATPHYPLYIDVPNGAEEDWFETNNAPTTTCSTDTANCPAPVYLPGAREEIEPTDIEIAKNTFGNISGGAALQWDSERDLYARLKSQPAMLGHSTFMDTFFTNTEAGSVIKSFYLAEAEVAAILEMPGEWGIALTVAADSVAAIEDAADIQLGELVNANDRTDSLEVYWEVAAIRERLATHLTVVLEKQHLMDSLRQERAMAALPAVMALPANNMLQSNRKSVLQIYLEIAAVDATQLTAGQFDTISAIAHQCPLAGGNAVYMARSLYQLNGQKRFNDLELCNLPIERSADVPVAAVNTTVLLWPNPASGQVQINVPGIQTEQSLAVFITDISGRIVFEDSFTTVDGNIAFDASKLSSGLYFCRVSTSRQAFAPVRLVITH